MSRDRRPRSRYSEASAAMRRALLRADGAELTGREWRTLGAVLILTASYSRTSDYVYVADVARLTTVDERHVRRALHRLAELGVILWEPGRGRSKPSLLGLPEGKRGPLPALLPRNEQGAEGGPALLGRKGGRLGHEKGAADDAKRGPQPAPHPRRDPRRSAEKGYLLKAVAVDVDEQHGPESDESQPLEDGPLANEIHARLDELLPAREKR